MVSKKRQRKEEEVMEEEEMEDVKSSGRKSSKKQKQNGTRKRKLEKDTMEEKVEKQVNNKKKKQNNIESKKSKSITKMNDNNKNKNNNKNNNNNKDDDMHNKSIIPLNMEDDNKDEIVKKKKRKTGKERTSAVHKDRGVIYLGHIPYGFFETQMKKFFSQFGTVTRLRLVRNSKTGKSKHHAFIEFANKDVAEIVAESMNNYLLYGRRMVCEVVPEEKLHEGMFAHSQSSLRFPSGAEIARSQFNGKISKKSDQQVQGRVTRLRKKDEQKRKKLAALGIEYDFEGYTAILPSSQNKAIEQPKKSTTKTIKKKAEKSSNFETPVRKTTRRKAKTPKF